MASDVETDARGNVAATAPRLPYIAGPRVHPTTSWPIGQAQSP
jgi:hypothetical protein